MIDHIAPPGVAPGFGYSHVVAATGRLIVVSGQVALDESGRLVGVGDPEAQARQVFENLRRCLAAADATFTDVVKFTVYVTDLAAMTAVRAVRDEYIDTTRPPTSSAVQVAGLVLPELLLEIDALAVS